MEATCKRRVARAGRWEGWGRRHRSRLAPLGMAGSGASWQGSAPYGEPIAAQLLCFPGVAVRPRQGCPKGALQVKRWGSQQELGGRASKHVQLASL